MKQQDNFQFSTIYFVLIAAFISAEIAIASPSFINLQSRISKPNSSGYLESNNVQFRFSITDPLGTCTLFQEDFTNIDMTGSKGLINFKIGTGSKIYPVGPMAMPAVFTNFNSPLFNCQAGGTYTAASSDSRKLIMQFNDGSGWQTVPSMEVNSVPFSLESLAAQKLGSYPAADYVRSAQFTSCSGAEAVHFNGTNFTCVALSSGASYSAITGAAGTNTIDNTNYAQTWNWSTATTQNPMSMTADALTTGSLLNLTTSNNSLNSTNGILNVANTGASTSGTVARIQANSTAGSGFTVLANGNVGIGTVAPVTQLEVVGEIKVGNAGTACSAGIEGAFRWNATTHVPEFCDGSSWLPIPLAGSAGCTGPNAFSFVNVANAPIANVVTSNVITPAGCARSMGISVSGGGSPQISVNGGPWTTSTTIDPGQTVQIRLTASVSASTVLSAVVTIGTTTGTTWTVTTKASNTRMFITSGSFTGSLGGIIGADTACQTEAGVAGYGGFWKAIISDSIANAKDRLTLTYPIVKASNTSITYFASNLWSGNVTTQLSTVGSAIWTGTNADGTTCSSNTYYTCNDWSSSSGSLFSIRGLDNQTNSSWINYGASVGCSNSNYLYCIEQPDPGCAPGAFSFTDATNSALSTLITSNTVTPTGCATASQVIVSGVGNPEVSINGGPWVVSGTMNAGDTLAVRLTTSQKYLSAHKVRVFVGNSMTTWTVTTLAGGTKLFRTPTSYNGNLGGLAGGDSACQAAATTLGYTGTWKAILSSSTVNAKDRLTITYPVVRASDGAVIAVANLWSGGLSNAPEVVAPQTGVFTGSDSAGVKSSTDWCSDWTDGSSGTAVRGLEGNAIGTWLAHITTPCSGPQGLYCVEQ